MVRMMITLGLASVVGALFLQAQGVASTSEFSRSHPTGLLEGGPLCISGGVGWTEDGAKGVGGITIIFTPGERHWGENYLDAPKALAQMKRFQAGAPGFEFEYILTSGQSLRTSCRVYNLGTYSGPLYLCLDHYEPGKGYRIFRNGVLLHQEFFDPQLPPPNIELKEVAPDQVEWRIQRSPKLEAYQVRVSWDEGKSWIACGFTDNHVILNLEESRRNPGIQPWIDFQIAQGLVVTARRYVMGKGFIPIK